MMNNEEIVYYAIGKTLVSFLKMLIMLSMGGLIILFAVYLFKGWPPEMSFIEIWGGCIGIFCLLMCFVTIIASACSLVSSLYKWVRS